MSSLAATQADGYYFPPEFFESGAYKKQSKLQKGPQKHTIRFALPYDGFCDSCHRHIASGTRFNAKKLPTNQFYLETLPILEFRMKCPTCSLTFCIRTDPQNRDYTYHQGIQKRNQGEKVRDNDREARGAVIVEEQGARSDLERLEDARIAVEDNKQLARIQKSNATVYGNDADANASLRQAFRKDRKSRKRQLHSGEKKGWRPGMSLLDTSIEDRVGAKSTIFGNGKETEQKKLKRIRQEGIFAKTAPSSSLKNRNPSVILKAKKR